MLFSRRPASPGEMRQWHKQTPRRVPVFVFGRHALETRDIEENVGTLEHMGLKVFKVPAKRTVLREPGHHDREHYNRYLARTFPGRHVVDLHTARGCHVFEVKRFARTVVGMEIPDELLTTVRASIAIPAITRAGFKKKVEKINY